MSEVVVVAVVVVVVVVVLVVVVVAVVVVVDVVVDVVLEISFKRLTNFSRQSLPSTLDGVVEVLNLKPG